ncbi:MAG: Phosphoserine phosphatase [uncultured Sphingomonadaceae bacterium]|uniref:Phosphoserine phosphatase n=1 Tax=uncultured Sphingomonadaceae bacterium TaxID=169976 RepID=A0A6J4T5J0_9SPHN|nr:MAG: Phosphoserine phosphatase [uncultured Sphingomonadaceae bacterium]
MEEGSAADVAVAGDRAAARAVLEAALPRVDAFVQPAEGRAKRLLVADMDSTMITVECIDELADYAGVGRDVAEITESAMRGELDFVAALRARVALLAGLPEAVLGQCLRERVRITPGARALVRTMRERAGARTCLVSGGFTAFAAPVAAEIGFEAHRANVLEIADGRLTGRVLPPVLGAEAKAEALAELAGELPREATLAVGDGANDVPMLQAAGFGVAYRAKPRAAEAADAAVRIGDLTALLWAQGYPRAAWAAG